MSRFNIIIICLASSLIMGIFFIFPKYESYGLLKGQIKLKQNELNFRKEYLDQLYQTSKKLDDYQDKLIIIDSALPKEPSLPNLFNFLQMSASQNGLVVRNIFSLGSVFLEESSLKSTNIGITLSGPYSSLQGLVEKLEKSSRLIEIQSIDFQKPAKGKIFDFNLNIKVFHY